MKKSLPFIILLLLSGLPLRALDASISYATFHSPGGSYVEVYLSVAGKTVEFAPLPDSSFQASLEVVVLFKKDGQIVKFDKYRLNSPPTRKLLDFVDMKRYGLDNGQYELEVSVEDLHRPGNARKYAATLALDYAADRLGQSDIQLLASFKPAEPGMEGSPMVKSGYYFESLASGFYEKNASLLTFYNEIYNADVAIREDYLVSYSIEHADGADKGKTLSIGHKRRSCEKVCAVLQQMDISKLESGNYQLAVEVRNKQKQLLSRKTAFFQRSNPYLEASPEAIAAGIGEEFVAKLTGDELRYSLKAISMLVDETDGELLNTLLKDKKPEAMRIYLLSFWAKENPTAPQQAYEEYMKVAKAIDEQFRFGFGYGFETDRGYVFLKYGAPNDVVTVEDDPSAPPYEIWSYNQFPKTGQHNVKFLFYNPTLAHNGFVLLHSTARGEVNNPRWEVELYREQAPGEIEGGDYIDGTSMKDNIGRYAKRLMRDN